MHTYAHQHISATFGVCLCLLCMLLPEAVSSMCVGIMFVLADSGTLQAQPSICQIAGLPILGGQSESHRYRSVCLITPTFAGKIGKRQ